MNNQAFSWSLFNRVPIIGIVRKMQLEEIRNMLAVYVKSGLNTIEITMNTPGAQELISYAAKNYPQVLNVGAGTVCDEAELDKALTAGAQFVVAPVVNAKVIRTCVERGIPVFPGAYSPTEIYNAWTMGASMVKVFPANNLGPDFIRNVKAPLDQVKLLPTGGIDLENLAEFMNAGADAVGIGGRLFHKEFITDKNWDGLKTHFSNYVNAMSVTRKNIHDQ